MLKASSRKMQEVMLVRMSMMPRLVRLVILNKPRAKILQRKHPKSKVNQNSRTNSKLSKTTTSIVVPITNL